MSTRQLRPAAGETGRNLIRPNFTELRAAADELLADLLDVSCACPHPDLHEVQPSHDGTTWLLTPCGGCRCPGGVEGWPWIPTGAERRAAVGRVAS